MKTLLISDVHSNIIALEAVWRKESDADMIVCAGDIVDYGPCPRECIDWMIDRGVNAVLGNHDRYVIGAYEQPAENISGTWRIDNAQKLSEHHIDYLKNLPDQLILEIEGHIYGVCHEYRGYEIIRSVETYRTYGEDRFGQSVHYMILGHTHRRALCYLSDDHSWLNPGSTSYRREDESFRGAHYSVIQDGNVSLREVPYPRKQVFQQVLASTTVGQSEKDVISQCWASE